MTKLETNFFAFFLFLVSQMIFLGIANADVPKEYLTLAAKIEKFESKLSLETPTFEEVEFLREQLGGNPENIFLHARMNQVELHFIARDKLAKKFIKSPRGLNTRAMFGAFSYGQLFLRAKRVEKYLKAKEIIELKNLKDIKPKNRIVKNNIKDSLE